MAVETENTTPVQRLKKMPEQFSQKSSEHLKTVAMRKYSHQQSQSIDEESILNLLPMVNAIARRAASYLKPPLSFEDLVSAGTVGLIRAARDFDSSHEAEFKTYAYIRIKGAILDELRKLSFLPSNRNKQSRDAMKLSREILEQTGTTPSDQILADKLGISIEQLYELHQNARAQNFISIEALQSKESTNSDILPSANVFTPDSKLVKTELIEKLAEAIQQLDTKRRRIILLYYHQELTMKQIAEALGVTESRVSQLHASALFNLSIILRQWKDV